MKFIHVADIHASRERLPQTLSILNTLTERCKKGDIDFIVFAGDFWDSTITATKGSGFSDIVNKIRFLSKWTCLYFIYGTPSHEPSGSLDAFRFDNTYVFDQNKVVLIGGSLAENKCKTKLICIPEPRRSNYIASSASETDNLINDEIKTFLKEEIAKPVSFLKGIPESTVTAEQTIVIYHGEVKGAVYQNGVSASSPTAIPKELLESLNADYYALGHIHKPQEVFKNAWYSGSACPKDFGETHDGCYNLVTIKNGETKVERVSFGLPIFETYRVGYPFKNPHGDWSNYHIRLQFDITKEERKSLNIKQLADEIKEQSHALSVKLEPNVIETESASKSEVVKHKSIVEKMVEYAKERSLKLPKHAKELLQNIQDSTIAKLAYPQHSFELLSLSLRGAIGIRNGQHKEDFDIDFEKLEDGVVCLVGNNGAGKTTITENCHPYPRMLTREGTLKEHFYLKDSHRILVYKDENDLYYKISMLIDGKTATGKTSYFVETSKDRKAWNSIPDIDGSLEAYKLWVEQTFGSVDIFLRTAFFAKEQVKNTPDIADTTKSERMELLSKLAGTDHLKEVSSVAKELRKELEKSVEKIELLIDSYSKHEDSIKANEQDITSWSNELKGQEAVVSSLEKAIAELKVKDAEYQKVKAVAEANSALYYQYKKEFDEKKSKLDDFEKCANNKDIYDNIAECNEELRKNAPRIDELTKVIDEKQKALEPLTNNLIVLNKQYNELTALLDKQTNEMNFCQSQMCEINGVCPTCGSPLSDHKRKELEEHNAEMQKRLDKLNASIKSTDEEVTVLKHKCNDLDKLRDDLAAEVEGLKKELEKLLDEKEENVDYIQKYNQLYIEWTYDEVIEEAKRLSAELDELQSKMDDIVDSECVEDVSKELSEVESKLKREQNHLAELNANIKAAERENEKYRQDLESIAGKKAELKELTEKVTAYNFIEDAFSNNGIPAIELRESAPEIADIANKILADSYGNKFEIRFGPTSEIKAKRKANEDFNIIVLDTENDDEKTIDLVSSGERIWIKQALFYAFSIVQMNRTGFNFRTRLIDESDGSLDGSLRPKYLKMVTAAHHIADSRITVLITHSQEIKDIAQQIIEI